MIWGLRVAIALLGKELQHHAGSLVGALALIAVGAGVSWSMGLQEDWVTLLDAALSLVTYAMPALALFVASRLVVVDHHDRTHEFLAALPMSPLARAGVRLGLGLAVAWGATLGVVALTAAIASRREGVPFGFVAQLAVQLGLYVYAWWGVSFGVAHLGRFRWLVWWLLFVLTDVVDGFVADPLREVYWFGLVRDGADRARLDPPWEAAPLAIGWGTAGIVLGVAVSVWRGGALLERWFRPTTAHQRAQLVGVGLAAMLGASAAGDLAPTTDPWAALPAVPAERATVRVAASPGAPLWAVGGDAAAALDGLGVAIGVASWPPVVVLRSSPEVGERPVRVAPGTTPLDEARVLLVDPDVRREVVVRGIVREATVHRLAALADWDADAVWLTDGLAAWWLGQDVVRLEALAREVPAGVAHSRDWFAVRAALGPERAEAAAWAGLAALEQVGGRDAAVEVARVLLGHERHSTGPGGARLRWTVRGDWVARAAGVDDAAWRAEWAERLGGGGGDGRWPALAVDGRDGEVVVSWSGEAPPDAAIEWLALDALQARPLPQDEVERVVPEPDAREVAVRADARARVTARWVVDAPGGVVTGPWVEVQP